MGGTLSSLAPLVRSLAGALSLGFCFLAAWQSLSYFLTKKRSFHLWLSLLLALAGVLFLLSAYKLREGWILDTVIIVALGIVLFRIAQSLPSYKAPLIIASTITLTLSLLIPILLVVNTQQQSYTSLHNNLSDAINSITQNEKHLETLATTISTNAAITATLNGGATTINSANLSQLMVKNQLNELTIVNPNGVVISSAENAERNQNLVATYPWLLDVLNGTTVSGTILSYLGEPSTVAAIPLSDARVSLGALIIAQPITTTLATATLGSYALASSQTVTDFSNANTSEATIFTSASFRSALMPYVGGNPTDSFQFHIVLNGSSYRVVGIANPTLNQDENYAIVTLDPEQANRLGASSIVILSLLATVITGFAAHILTKRYLHGTVA